MMRILFLLLSCLAAGAHAEAESSVAASAWGLPQLMQSLAQMQTSRAHFVERKHLKVLDMALTSSGTLSFRAPGHLEKHTLEPREDSLVLDQGVLTIENRARNIRRTLVLQEYPVVWAFVESIRSTLAGDLPTLERFYQIELTGDASKWRMKLRPRDQRTQQMVSEIVFAGRGDRVTTIEMLESSGDRSTMTVIEETK